VHDKRVDAVIKAFGMIKSEGITLTIIGDGLQREALERLASAQPNAGNISFIGNVSRQEVIRAMEQADCFALVSERETFGMVYIEAMSTGAISIGSAGEGISGIINSGENGFTVNSGDAGALADKMRALIAMSDSEVNALSRAARDSVKAMRDDILAEKALESLMQK
jgi:glycosyltransferase involved in cell wall biosynthesis